MSEIIDPLANVNEEVYYSKFKTFRFGNQSTVFAHCTVQVCLNSDECSQVREKRGLSQKEDIYRSASRR